MENISAIDIFLYASIFVTVVLLLLAKAGKISQTAINNYILSVAFSPIIYFLFAGPDINYQSLSPPKNDAGVSVEKIVDKEAVRVIDGLEKRLKYFEEELGKTRADLSALNNHHNGINTILAIAAFVFVVMQLSSGNRKEIDKMNDREGQ